MMVFLIRLVLSSCSEWNYDYFALTHITVLQFNFHQYLLLFSVSALLPPLIFIFLNRHIDFTALKDNYKDS